METLNIGKSKRVEWDYDQEADVLDISFGKPEPALSKDLGSGIVVRYLEKSGEVVGFTIVGLKHVVRPEASRESASVA